MIERVCFRCGASLTKQDVCLQCGEDLRLYKRILINSDRLYNLGLERAQARDLTAAENYLVAAIQHNKSHIQARNLLGLVYYEMGEPALALKEWIISTSYQPEDNPAEKYLKNTEKNMHSINGSVTRYNMAITYLSNNNRDLAVIQLKQLVGRSYKMLKAMQLMALLYIQDEHYSKAQKLLKECHKIDRGNPVTRKYYRAIEEHKRASRGNSYREAMSRAMAEGTTNRDVIIPKNIREYGSYFMYVLYIIIGVIIGAGLVYFVVVPTVRTKEQDNNRQALINYEDSIGLWQNEVVKKNSEIEKLEASINELKDKIGSIENVEEDITYDVFLPVLEAYTNNDPRELEEAFLALSFDTSNSEYMRVYGMIKAYIMSNLADYANYLGMQYINGAKYDKALKMFKYAVEKEGYTSQNLFYIGLSYQLLGQNEWSIYYYKYCMVTFPDGNYYSNSRVSLEAMLEAYTDLVEPDPTPGELGSGKVETNYDIVDPDERTDDGNIDIVDPDKSDESDEETTEETSDEPSDESSEESPEEDVNEPVEENQVIN